MAPEGQGGSADELHRLPRRNGQVRHTSIYLLLIKPPSLHQSRHPGPVLTRDSYMANIGRIIAKAQITNGGPVILVQPENEYSGATGVPFPVGQYMQYVEDQLRKAGIVVPLISNDASPGGYNAPGTGEGEVDIYVRQSASSTCVSMPAHTTTSTGPRRLSSGLRLRRPVRLAEQPSSDVLPQRPREAEPDDAVLHC